MVAESKYGYLLKEADKILAYIDSLPEIGTPNKSKPKAQVAKAASPKKQTPSAVNRKMSAYDKNNVFAKILRGEIPSYKIFETEHCMAILDAFPGARGHSLLLPKGEFATMGEMSAEAAAAVFQELP